MGLQIDVYAPGADVTGVATAAVTARRFVAVSGNRSANGNVSVAPAGAGLKGFGVAKNDALVGGLVSVARGNSRVVKVKAATAIAANADVEVGSAGQVVTKTTGVAVGYAISGAASGADAHISLY